MVASLVWVGSSQLHYEGQHVGGIARVAAGKCVARFKYRDHESVWVQAPTRRAAQLLLEKEIDKRSIGLFGEDETEFMESA